KVGRNDACPCGSGKKYKKCCAIEDSKNPLVGINYLGEQVRVNKEMLDEVSERLNLLPFKKALKDRSIFDTLTVRNSEKLDVRNECTMFSDEEGLELLEELYGMYNDVNSTIDNQISCKKGCSSCCNLYVDVSPIEAEYI